MSKKTLILLTIIVIFINVGLDQGTKVLAREYIQGEGRIEVLGDVFVLVYHENPGAFLGMGSELTQPLRAIMLLILPLLMIAGLIAYMFLNKEITRGEAICMATIAGGGIGNLIDRIFMGGAVSDFMNFGIGSLRTGILNVADLSITFGVIVLLYFNFKAHYKQSQETKEKKAQ